MTKGDEEKLPAEIDAWDSLILTLSPTAMESLSQAISNLESSATTFCSDFLENLPLEDQQRRAVNDQLRIISDRLSIVLSKLHYSANTIAPPSKLPPELLRAIFSYLRPGTYSGWEVERIPPYDDLLAVGRVCRRWREIAVSATELWTYIILAAGVTPAKDEMSIARLCVRRSGTQPLDFCFASFAFDPLDIERLIPDRRRLRSLVYLCMDGVSEDGLPSFLLPALYLERLEIWGNEDFPLPALFPNTPRCLRELVVSRGTPCPADQFGSLTSLNLLCQTYTDGDIYPLLSTLRCCPHLEELFLQSEFRSAEEPQRPQEPKTTPIPLHSLKRLHICRLPPGVTKRILGALDLLPNGICMRLTNISADLGAIFPEGISSELSPRAATKLEVIYPSAGGTILHATNGVAHTRLTYPPNHPPGYHIFRWIAGGARERYSLKELWLHLDRSGRYEVPPPHAFPDLETLVIESDPNEFFEFMLFLMLRPNKDGVPSPLLSILELRNVFGVGMFGDVLKARSDAGFRLKTLRIGWSNCCTERMAPLDQLVDNLEFYHVTGGESRGLDLPKECMTRSRWWEPWARGFVGVMECEVGW